MTASDQTIDARPARRRRLDWRELVWPPVELVMLCLLGATALTFFARTWWPFDLLTHFRMHYVLIGLVVLAFAIPCRRRIATLATIACMAVHGWWLAPAYLPSGGPAAADDGLELRIASINMLSNNPTPGQVLEQIKAYDADVIALQETTPWSYDPPAELIELYPYAAPLIWEYHQSVILLSRHPIQHFDIRDGRGFGLVFPSAEIEIDGRLISVIAVHPPYPIRERYMSVRRRYLEAMAEAVADAEHPTIMLGDFNTTPYSPLWNDLMEATELRNAADGYGYVATWLSMFGWFGIPIDHVLVDSSVAVRDVTVGAPNGSDHLPLVVDLTVNPAGQ